MVGKGEVKNKKFWLTVVAIVFALIILIGSAVVVVLLFFGGRFLYVAGIAPMLNASVERDIQHYRDYPEEILDDGESFHLFPETIGDGMAVSDYFFANASFKYYKEDHYQIFLDVAYTDEGYEAELLRLEEYSQTYTVTITSDNGEQRQKEVAGYLLYDDMGVCFQERAYIAQYNGKTDCYEYALVMGENRIVYVYLEGKVEKGDLRIPVYYLPKGYYQGQASAFSYNVYEAESVRDYLYPTTQALPPITEFGRETTA